MFFIGTFDPAALGANNGLNGNATPAFPHQLCYAAFVPLPVGEGRFAQQIG
jgi:hypothetical protein